MKTISNYCEKYDAHYHLEGNWLEKQCSNPLCDFCCNRPDFHQKDCKEEHRYHDWFRKIKDERSKF